MERKMDQRSKENVFQQECRNLNLHFPDYAHRYFLTYPFKTIREMVEKMILLGHLSLEDMTEEKFASFFSDRISNVVLPLYGTSVSCAFTSPADDYIESYLSLDSHLIQHPASTFFVRAAGECMKEIIHPGDLLIVDRSLEAVKDRIVLAVLNGEFTVKRLVQTRNSVILRPENPAFQEITVTPDMDFRVWGVVTYIIHKAD